jgi:O-antigen/teichoic acid export membrane protein
LDNRKAVSLGNELKKLSRHGVTYGVSQVLNRIAGFLLIPLYTHYLSANDYGIFQLVGITIEIVGIVISLGIADAIYRFYYDMDNPEDRKTVISSACIGVFMISTLVLGLLSMFASELAGWILEEGSQGIYILLALGNLWFNTMGDIFFTYLRIKERSGTYLIASLIKTVASLSLIVYLIVHLEKGLLGIFIGNLVVSMSFLVVSLPYLISQVGCRLSFSVTISMLRYSLPIIPANLASLIVNASDRYFIKGYLSLSEVGIYTLGYRLGNAIHYLVRVPFMQIWAPRRFALYNEGAPPEMFARIATYYIGLMLFGGLGVSIFVHDLIKIIAPAEYWRAALYTPAIAFCYIVYSLDNHVAIGIAIVKKMEYWAYVNLGIAGINLVLNYILISSYGVWGAVASTLISICFKVTALHIISREFFRIPFEWLRMLGLFLVALGIYSVRRIGGPDSLALAFVWDSMLVTLYPVALWVLGMIKQDEKEALVAIAEKASVRIGLRISHAKEKI